MSVGMRTFALILTLTLLTGSARADGPFDFATQKSVQHRKRVGIGLLATGLTISAVGLAVMLGGAASQTPNYDYYNNKEVLGPNLGLVIAGGPVAALGLIFVGMGAPILAVANEDAKGLPSVQTLQRRRAGGYALIGVGLAMQVVGTVVATLYMPKIFDYSPPDQTRDAADAAGLSIALAGVAVMTSGIPLVSTASRDLKLRVGLGSVALSF
jgi:hypothetical protein